MSGYLQGPQKASQLKSESPNSAERSPPLAPVLCFGSSFRYQPVASAAAELPLYSRHNAELLLGVLYCYRSENVLQSLMAFDGINDGVTLVESFEPGTDDARWSPGLGCQLRTRFAPEAFSKKTQMSARCERHLAR